MEDIKNDQFDCRGRTLDQWTRFLPLSTLDRALDLWSGETRIPPADCPSRRRYLVSESEGEPMDALTFAKLLALLTAENAFGEAAWTAAITGLAAFHCVETFMQDCSEPEHGHKAAFRNYLKHTAQGLLHPEGQIAHDLALKISQLPWNPEKRRRLQPVVADGQIAQLIETYMGTGQ